MTICGSDVKESVRREEGREGECIARYSDHTLFLPLYTNRRDGEKQKGKRERERRRVKERKDGRSEIQKVPQEGFRCFPQLTYDAEENKNNGRTVGDG